MLQLCIGEVAEHCSRRGGLHCQGMVRAFPGIELRGVTAGAGLGANESGRLIGTRSHPSGQRQHDHNRQGGPP
jgi:hypothetical protein